jgi:alkylation response protein AidB-like acyl-CoA dehydrogenase
MATLLKADTKPTPFADHKLPGLLDQAIALQPLLEEKAAEANELRSPTKAVEDAFREMGAFSLLLPERLGGVGLSLSSFARIQMEIGKGDPSMSWVLQIINGTSWISSLASDAIQDELFANGPTNVCGAYNPPGKAVRVEGGYKVTGAWPYSSGSRQANWAQCGILFEGDDVPTAPGISMAYIPMDQITIKDSWYVTGMQATGSDTTCANDVFVPEHLIVTMDKPYGTIVPGKRHFGAASDWLAPVPSVRATGLAQLLGAARKMQEICEAESKKKPVVTTMFKTRLDSAVYLHDLGKVAAQLDSAETLLFDALDTLDGIALQGMKPDVAVCSKQRAQCAQIVELIHASIEKIMFISTSSAFAFSNPLQRYWRDIHVGLRHIQNVPMIGYEIYGRDNLGALPNITPVGAY